MRNWIFFLVISLFVGTAAPARAGDRVALVIGNGDYQKVPVLPNPLQDSSDIGQALERLNFKVTKLNNATAAELRKAVVGFGRAAEGSDIAVVFYAGHGMEAGGENWLIPIDAELHSDTDVESEGVSLRSVNLQVSRARQLGLVILDACRNNPFAAKMRRSISTRAVVRGLAPTEPTDNVLVAYAARDGTTASDGNGRNSPFTTALLRNIETPGLEISFLFRRVRDDVMAATKREQQPFVYGSLSKDEIYLKAAIVDAPMQYIVNKSSASPPDDEKNWQAIKTSTLISQYEEFLSRYPASGHAVAAQERIKELNSTQIASLSPTNTLGSTPNDMSVKKEGRSPDVKPSDRSLFTSEDSRRVEVLATKLQLVLPPFADGTNWEAPISYAGFIGVWASKRGWGNGKGRSAMLIVTGVSADGFAEGYYLFGPPTKASWEQSPRGFIRFFALKIIDNAFSIKSGSQTIVAKLNKDQAMILSTFRPTKPSEKARIELNAMWRPIASASAVKEPSRREQTKSATNPNSERSKAAAVEGDARCNKMDDRLACLCAVKNGGGITPDGRGWYSKRGGVTALTNEAFVQCQLRAGR